MKLCLVAVLAVTTLFSLDAAAAEPAPAPKADASAQREEAAVKAALAWLALVDGGKYAESWKEAAELFRGAVPQESWVQQVGGVRKPLGKVHKREVKSKSFQTSLPGAPDGQYVVIQFEASFESKKAAVETVTPLLDKDGKWRVSGYFIK